MNFTWIRDEQIKIYTWLPTYVVLTPHLLVICDISFVFAKHPIAWMGENFGLPLLTEKFMGIEFINELHLNEGWTDKNIHVTPHICCPYSPLTWHMRYFVCVCETSHCVNGTKLGIAFIDWKTYGNWLYKWTSLESGMCTQKSTRNSPHSLSLLPT